VTPPVWVPLRAIIIIHDRQISRHGGAPGLRDMAPLEMGCARPMNLGFRPPPMEDLASGAVDEPRFADWLGAGMHPR
jgi:hypothetical protein